jgi:hypothetical protein
MNIFMAAVYTNGFMKTQKGSHDKLNEFEKTHFEVIPNVLESWHYVGKQRYVDDMRRNDAKVFLDSGAFSDWTMAKKHNTGLKLNVADYCAYIQRNMDILRVEDGDLMASVLDGIGDPYKTYQNQLEMEWRGVRPLPCFHFGEDERYLEHYVKNYSYITIGGMVGKTQQQLMTWLDRIFDRYICDKSGRPRLKVHGFGLTSVTMMESFPWYSCDSSSWIQYAVYGHIFHPRYNVITVSGKSPRRHDMGMHVTTLTDVERQFVYNEFANIGFDVERLMTVYESRAAVNMWSFKEINRIINVGKSELYSARKQELF